MDNVTNRRIVMMETDSTDPVDGTPRVDVDVFVHSPNPVFPRTDDWSYQLTLNNITN